MTSTPSATAPARAGGWRCTPDQKASVEANLWVKGKLNRHVIAKDAEAIAREEDEDLAKLGVVARQRKHTIVGIAVYDRKAGFLLCGRKVRRAHRQAQVTETDPLGR